MTTTETINGLVDQLREGRRAKSLGTEVERLLLEQIGELIKKLWSEDEDEWERVNSEGWRGWPDLYDAVTKLKCPYMVPTVEYVETAPDPDDSPQAGQPPRKVKETGYVFCPYCPVTRKDGVTVFVPLDELKTFKE